MKIFSFDMLRPMNTISYIALHHAGGIGNDPYASSLFLTHESINRAHQARWNFRSSRGFYGGYNVAYDPKTREFFQYRAIGEETAAQKGFNFNTFSLCVIGNYMVNPRTGRPVDMMHAFVEEDIARFLLDLINGNRRGLEVVRGTIIDLSVTKINPHRYYQLTDCNGSSLPDNWGRKIILNYEYKNNPLLRQLFALLTSLKIITQPFPMLGLASRFDRGCDGCIDL